MVSETTPTPQLTATPLPPTQAKPDAATINEDSASAPLAVLANDGGQNLRIIGFSAPAHGSVSGVGPDRAWASLSYTPQADFSGPDSFIYAIAGDDGGTSTATVSITVNVVNSAPSFVRGPDQRAEKNAGAQAASGWATGISSGPPNEAGQSVSFLVANDNRRLFSVQPAVAPDGTLSYTPAPNISGTANVRVRLQDSGGTANGGVDTSAEQVFAITVGSGGIGVDFNRDGTIDYDKLDKTGAAKPFLFWLNDDRDFYDVTLEDEADDNPALGGDSRDDRISLQRDLEDFTRVHIEAPADFRPDAGWRYTLRFADASGAPRIRLWRAVSPDNKYLTDPAVALKQTGVGIGIADPERANWIIGTAEQEIPTSLFKSIGANRYSAAFLFEGMRAGKGALVVHFYKPGTVQPIEGRVWLDLHPVKDFYDHYDLALGNLNSTAGYSKRGAVPAITTSQTSDYILFVHGWRMKPWHKVAFAETAFKRLWQRGYKGHFGLFSWPTEYVETADIPRTHENRLNYDRSERKAWQSAATLRSILRALNTKAPGQVRIVAHSMGNVVVSEALLLESESLAPRKIAHTYVATQAASPAQAYDASVQSTFPLITIPNVYKSYWAASRPYFAGSIGRIGIRGAAERIVNYHNVRDHALGAWRLNQFTKPDTGYGYATSLVPLHSQGAFYRGSSTGLLNRQTLQFPNDRYEIFAHAAPATGLALGAGPVGGQVSANRNLATQFGFTSEPSDHSAQFNSNLMTRYRYWDTLMTDFRIKFLPPK